MEKLEKSREELRIIKEKLAMLNENSQKQMAVKDQLEQQAMRTKKNRNNRIRKKNDKLYCILFMHIF